MFDAHGERPADDEAGDEGNERAPHEANVEPWLSISDAATSVLTRVLGAGQ